MHPDPLGLARTLSPVDLPEPLVPPPHPLRWTSTVIAVAALFLALLNAHAIRGWAYQLPEGAAAERTVRVAEAWYGIVGRGGLNRPVEAMHDRWQRLKSARFEVQARSSTPSSRSARAYSSSASG